MLRIFKTGLPVSQFPLYFTLSNHASRMTHYVTMQQTEKYWNLINRIVLVAIAIMAGVGVVLAFTPKVKQMQSYQQTLDDLEQRIEITETAEKEMKENIRRFKTDPAYVEKVAHEVGYARTNETIFHFPEETGGF